MKTRLMLSTTSSGKTTRMTIPLGILPVVEDAVEDLSGNSCLGGDLLERVTGAVRAEAFTGRHGQTLTLHFPDHPGMRCLMLVGLGPRGDMTPERLRSALGTAARQVPNGLRASSSAVLFAEPGQWSPSSSTTRSPATRSRRSRKKADSGGSASPSVADSIQAATEGWILGSYEHTTYKTEKKEPPVPALTIRVDGSGGGEGRGTPRVVKAGLRKALKVGELVADGVVLARDLSNDPANVLTPVSMAQRARRLARSVGLTCRVLDEAGIRRERMGAILGVASGSEVPPRFIILEHCPPGKRGSRRPLVFVGKAVTFDSGGISIKPARGMEEMKADMAGGAAVLAALTVIARLGIDYPVVGLIPCAENMISARAIRPGDVIASRSGLTIEVINTDAEGRLLLADALDYSRRFKPRMVVDLATLTGACVVALGTVASGLMTNDSAAVELLKSSASRCGERVWQLPLDAEYLDAMKSDTADLKNSGGRPAGAITAAAFLSRFIEGVPWVHMDIAGPAWSSRVKGHVTRGATGVGVRTLVALAQDVAAG